MMNSILEGYQVYRGVFDTRETGSLIASNQGTTTSYGLWKCEPRGIMFVDPQTEVYEGMVVGEHSKNNDLVLNPTKMKNQTNVRTSSMDEAIRLEPVLPMTLEKAIEFIKDDEVIEVTPLNIRIRKKTLQIGGRKVLKYKSRAINTNWEDLEELE